MEKDKIFLGEVGLTKTAADFISNLAKEKYQHIEQELENIKFYNETVQLIGSSERSILRRGVKELSRIEEMLNQVAQLKSLIAWFREAIKAKERLQKEIECKSYDDFGIDHPTMPESVEEVTEDDIIATWNIKQRNKFFYLQTMCSQIGKYIHPQGAFARERLEMQKIVSEPNRVEGSGRDTLLYTRTTSLPPLEVENTFMKLQQLYRSYQAELNSMKHELQIIVEKEIQDRRSAYDAAFNQYKVELSIADNKLKQEKQRELSKLQNLKIIIPDSLKAIYQIVEKTGKEK